MKQLDISVENVNGKAEQLCRSQKVKRYQSLGRDLVQLKFEIGSLIGGQLQRVEESISSTLSTKFGEVQDLADRASMHAGKRLRPILVLLASKAVAGPTCDPNSDKDLVHIATSVELVHMASLVHDDLMDHAETRRHQPTISHACGENAAVLLGDYLFTRAYAAAAECRQTLPARMIARAATHLCEGELRQQLSASQWKLNRSNYFSILFQKTASLCQVSCRLGGWRSGANHLQQKVLADFGKYLGLAFQIHDDWLDYWGDEEVGKTLGTDLAQLKPTLPLMEFMNCSTENDKAELLIALTRPTHESLAHARRMIRESTAGERTLKAAQRLAAKAIRALDTLPESESKQLLKALAVFSVSRSV
ncbi:MAG: polyprenyl synthetase family protein [Pirellulales bacterium]